MFADNVRYTALMGKDEEKAWEILKINREIHIQQLGKFNGTLIKEVVMEYWPVLIQLLKPSIV